MALLFLAPPALTCAWDNALARQLFSFFGFSLRVFAYLQFLISIWRAWEPILGCGRGAHEKSRWGLRRRADFAFAPSENARSIRRIPRQAQSKFECRMRTFTGGGGPSPPPSEPFVERNIKGLRGGHAPALGGTQTQ